VSRHQGSSPTGVFSAVKQLVKGTELIAHRMTLMENELRTLQQANQALAKRRRARKAHDSGVRLSLSFASTSAPAASSSFTRAPLPLPAAYDSVVRLLFVFASSTWPEERRT